MAFCLELIGLKLACVFKVPVVVAKRHCGRSKQLYDIDAFLSEQLCKFKLDFSRRFSQHFNSSIIRKSDQNIQAGFKFRVHIAESLSACGWGKISSDLFKVHLASSRGYDRRSDAV